MGYRLIQLHHQRHL